MKSACQHLLCRRDLSCTKVNAVNRLTVVRTRAADRLSTQEAAPPAAAEGTPPGERGSGPSAHLALAGLDGRSVGSKQIDAALQTGKHLEQVSPVSRRKKQPATFSVSSISVGKQREGSVTAWNFCNIIMRPITKTSDHVAGLNNTNHKGCIRMSYAWFFLKLIN